MIKCQNDLYSNFKHNQIIIDIISTEANTAAQETEERGADWKGGGERSVIAQTPSSANMIMHNAGKVKFDPPKVPVIFVLGTFTAIQTQCKCFSKFFILH